MANLGLQTLYAHLNACDTIVAERFFVRPKGGKTRSEESQRPLRDFSAIVFSVSFETGYLDIPWIIREAGVPLMASRRNDSHPMIMAGGVATSINPEPIAPFTDCFFLGDFEPVASAFISSLDMVTDTSVPRRSRLEAIVSRIPSAYVPGAYRPVYDSGAVLSGWEVEQGHPMPVRPALAEDVGKAPHTAVLAPGSAFSNMFMVELTRGCGQGCRFCAAGFVYRPPRPWPVESVREAVRICPEEAESIGLVGLEFAGKPDVDGICRDIAATGARLSFSSLRVDRLTPSFVRLLKASGTKTATIAPEAGSERLRKIINKNLSEEEILNGAEILFQSGIPNLKLYFMLGLPFETDSDCEAILSLVRKIKDIMMSSGRTRGRVGRITVTVSTFVPKAWTPFQWAGQERPEVLKRRRRILRRGVSRMPNVRLNLDSIREARIQAVLSRGDRRLSRAIEMFSLSGGLSFDKCIKKTGLEAEEYLRFHSEDRIFPWDIIGHRVEKRFLLREFKRAEEVKLTRPCLPGQCARCGACAGSSGGFDKT